MKNKAIYSVSGKVAHGKKLGRQIGFRTVNLPLPENGAPQNGVYAAELIVAGSGERYIGVLNQGLHPTFPSGAPSIEMHLIDAQADLYEREIEIRYCRFLRPEMRFASGEELAAQIARDVETTRSIFAEN